MAKKQRRSRDGGPDRPERFPDYIPYQRRESEPVPEGTPHLETQSSPSPIDDAAAVEAARARALAVNAERHEPEEEEKNAMVEFAKTAGSYTASVGKGGVKVAVQAVGMMGYLGYHTSRPIARGLLVGIDWLAHKMNKKADKMIDKNVFLFKYLVNPVVSLLDGAAKKLGLDKTLAEHLKKNDEDRKKLAEKVLKDYKEAQKKQEKKEDDAAAKAKRRKVLEEKLGEDVAAAIADDVDSIAAATDSKTAEAPAPAPAPEAPKAAA